MVLVIRPSDGPRRSHGRSLGEDFCSMEVTSPAPADGTAFSVCLQQMADIVCGMREEPSNVSRLVCTGGVSDRSASVIHTVLVAVTALIVPVSVALNMSVVVTVSDNRTLHTVINLLVSVLCLNNVLWTAIPVLIAIAPDIQNASLWAVFWFIIMVTRTTMFSTIVLITLLRYLGVVKNHSYPMVSCNVVAFVGVAVAPGLVRLAIEEVDKLAVKQCVMPFNRFLFFLFGTISRGAAAVLSPIVFVVFSVDFRRAFARTRKRLKQKCT
ncbi:hypothetical protein FJT64_006147 [Amphibalanus amphitrite]|uniref:G-protein coupled receptors family 1 profile domain-containing protein n=1 Tax=Amphibalanus amphitrite TaxID=1232801 RepID=A0A6A4VXU8_AMPAM|nr:hypothetical protein FJT64_006147 [Amphibalanus amphitrite]